MSKATELLSRLLVAGTGATTVERQAQARIKTREYLDRDKKEMKGEGVLAIMQETQVEVQAKRDEAEKAGEANLLEVYDAALTVFATWSEPKE